MSEDKQKENPTPITSDEKKPDEKKPATELTEKDLKEVSGGIYMKIDSIPGDATAEGHEKWIEL